MRGARKKRSDRSAGDIGRDDGALPSQDVERDPYRRDENDDTEPLAEEKRHDGHGEQAFQRNRR